MFISPGKIERAETEFRGHPDVISGRMAAELTYRLAEESVAKGFSLEDLRADLNVQIGTRTSEENSILVSVAGQVNAPEGINLTDLAKSAAEYVLGETGYFDYALFSPDRLEVTTEKITRQSKVLNETSRENRFADGCITVGHWIADPFGIDGTFSAARVGQHVAEALDRVLSRNPSFGLRPDGKVHVTGQYYRNGCIIDRVTIARAHTKGEFPDEGELEELIREELPESVEEVIRNQALRINPGGDFHSHFVQADAGVSKVKDIIAITGGLHTIGTDAFYGKCLYKASTTALPYAFALSRVVAEITHAHHAAVSVATEYNKQDALLTLHSIDHRFAGNTERINTALARLPRTRDEIREILEMPVTIDTYEMLRHPNSFHEQPWKDCNQELRQCFARAYTTEKLAGSSCRDSSRLPPASTPSLWQ